MLINLLVALLANVYGGVAHIAQAETNAVKIMQYYEMEWDPKYGLFTFNPPPFNLLRLPFVLCLVKAKP